MIQGSDEWRIARLGFATASKFQEVLSKGKGNAEAVGRRNYRVQLAVERLTGVPQTGYHNGSMDWGHEQEPFARIAYEAVRGVLVQQVGFLEHPSMAWVGASPDGLVGDDGGIQIKSPAVSANHIETIEAGEVPSEHMRQIWGELWVTGRAWWDFVSYDPRMPEHLQLFVKRVERDEKTMVQLAFEVNTFLSEVESMVERLSKRSA